MSFFEVLKALPTIIAAVRALEEAIPLPNKGREKLAFILDLAAQLGANVDVIRAVVDRVVKLLNVVGVFKSEPTAASAA